MPGWEKESSQVGYDRRHPLMKGRAFQVAFPDYPEGNKGETYGFSYGKPTESHTEPDSVGREGAFLHFRQGKAVKQSKLGHTLQAGY